MTDPIRWLQLGKIVHSDLRGHISNSRSRGKVLNSSVEYISCKIELGKQCKFYFRKGLAPLRILNPSGPLQVRMDWASKLHKWLSCLILHLSVAVYHAAVSTLACTEHSWSKLQKICQKFVKLTLHTYSCFTNFENEAHAMAGNGNDVNLLKLAWKIRKITSSELIFGGFEP